MVMKHGDVTKFLDVGYLKSLGEVPRVHGNGFIQLDLTKEMRMHVWGHPDIPKQEVSHPIHDHVFSFESVVLVGRLVNAVYDISLEVPQAVASYKLYTAIPNPSLPEDTKLGLHTEQRYTLPPKYFENVHAGQCYHMQKRMFHETFVTEPTMTIIKKDAPTLAQDPQGPRPFVAIPYFREPDNEFSRFGHDGAGIWRIIEEVIKL